MEPFHEDELTDRELDGLLKEWAAPPAPARLRAAVFPQASGSVSRRFWRASVRVPAPLAASIVLAAGIAVWQLAAPASPEAIAGSGQAQQLQPVAELRPVIIGSTE